MRKLLLLALVMPGFAWSSAQQYRPAEARIVQTVNRDWTFNYFPSGKPDEAFSSAGFDDSAWQAIALPHTWQTYETTGDIHPFIMAASEREDPYWWNGWGWYRKRLVIAPELEGKKIFAEFDGVQKYSKVYLNGHELGDHKGGYTSFYFDLTPYVRFGEENVLCVAVCNRRDDPFGTIPPATAGNFNVYGGIYRDVRIVVTDPVHVPFQGSYKHEGGTFVTTPLVTAQEAAVHVRTFVRNDTPEEKEITVKSHIADAGNRLVTSMESREKVSPGEIRMFGQESSRIRKPNLWSPESPYLYRVYTEVYCDGRLTDTYQSPLGFRFFEWDYQDDTLLVNGEKIHIHGTNRHQEYPWLGDAIPKWLTEMDMNDIRYNLAHNFMRAGHYPNDPFLYDYNDRHGIITVEEVPNIKPIDFDVEVQEQNLREMIRRDRNHPSIFFWSMGNETKTAADSKWAVEEDTTRILHERKAERYGDYVPHHAANLDMENLLRVTIRGWYNKDVRDLEPENNAEVGKSGQMAGTEEWQHKMARVDNGSIRGRIDKNIVAWLYEDHGADRIYKDSPLKNVNAKGWTDLYRVPKYIYYLWQANYLDRPMIFIHPHHWRESYLGQSKSIQVDSNCEEIELFANGKSLGKQYPSPENFYTVGYTDVPVERGTLRAVGRKGKEKTVYELRMAGKPARLTLTTSHAEIPADRSGLAIVTADIVDAEGVHVYGATNTLHWEASGNGTLVGCPVYETDIDKNSERSGSGYIDAPVSNVVRSTRTPGAITVRVSAQGLEPAEITIRTTPAETGRSGITEPELSDRGRFRVTRDTSFHENVEYVVEMERIVSPEHITASSTEEYRKAMQKYVVGRNPGIDKKSIEFRFLIDRLTRYIETVGGELTEDDYNFIARSYNDARMLARVIDTRNFHPDYAAALRQDYAEQLIAKGAMLDLAQETRRIHAIPRDAETIIVIESDKNQLEYERTRYFYRVWAKELEKAVALMRPEFTGLNAQEQKQALEYIDRINPNVWKENGTYRIRYETGIAIPKNLK